MQGSRPRSLFHGLKSRELNGFRVRKRPCFDSNSSSFTQIGAVSSEHNGGETLPLSISFSKMSKNAHLVAVSDEDGYVSVYDSSRKLTQFESYQENADKAKLSEWVTHHNAVFDICWIKEDTNILTASGDQTVKLWDTHEQKCIGVLAGHTGSVKSLCPHSTNSDLIVSGSRDGSFALWDLRCNSNSESRSGELNMNSTAMVKRAHISSYGKRARRSKTVSMSITSVLFLKDEVSIATAGAVDSIVKFWDTRNLKSVLTQTSPHPESSTDKDKTLHGISCLSQDSNGVFLSASCMNSRIYLYDVLRLESGPIKSFSGCQIGSFFVKSKISPDGSHILGGSSDGNAYIWQVKKPNVEPIAIKGHEGEVSSVDWCTFEDGKIVTSSDDFTVRFWNTDNIYSNRRSPSSVRRRIMALPTMERRRLFHDDEEPTIQTKNPEKSYASEEALDQFDSSLVLETPKVATTPEPPKRKFASFMSSSETLEKTPEASMRSPDSVLNLTSASKKRTIRDYFLSAS